MGQITEHFARSMLAHCDRGEHPPLTVWEAKQLLVAWLAQESAYALAFAAGMERAAEICDRESRLTEAGMSLRTEVGQQGAQAMSVGASNCANAIRRAAKGE